MEDALAATAAILRANGGFIAEDLTVHERGGQIWCSIGERLGEPGRLLAHYPMDLPPLVMETMWAADPHHLRLAEPVTDLTSPQQALLEAWLELIAALDRMSYVRGVVPHYAVRSQSLRHHLADSGHPRPHASSSDAEVRQTVVSWHGSAAGKATESSARWRLLPIKSLVNHHPDGAVQAPAEPGTISLHTGANSDDKQTYEDYGDLDAMMCLMLFGYVDETARVVHSVPVEVANRAVGKLVVRWRAPRNRAGHQRRDIPLLTSLGDHGLELRHLSFRPGNRAATAAFLAMAVQSRSGLTPTAARQEAERILDDILGANAEYYARLDTLVLEAAAGSDAGAAVLPTIAETSLRQQQRMREFWG